MNPAHFHLVINHFPIVGTLLAIPLFGLALLRGRDRGVWLAATVLLGLAGVFAGAAFLTGEPAEEYVEDMAGVTEAAIGTHEERAEVATVFAVLTGVGAIAAFAIGRKREGALLVIGPLCAAVVTGGLMVWTGAAGGAIRHPEIGTDGPGSASAGVDVRKAEVPGEDGGGEESRR